MKISFSQNILITALIIIIFFAFGPQKTKKEIPSVIHQTKVVTVNTTQQMNKYVAIYSKLGFTIKQVETFAEVKCLNTYGGEIWTNKEIIIVFEK